MAVLTKSRFTIAPWANLEIAALYDDVAGPPAAPTNLAAIAANAR